MNTNSGRLKTWTIRTNDLNLSRQYNKILYILTIIHVELDFPFMVILFIRFERRVIYFISFVINTISTHKTYQTKRRQIFTFFFTRRHTCTEYKLLQYGPFLLFFLMFIFFMTE
jgi:hypothetical protein